MVSILFRSHSTYVIKSSTAAIFCLLASMQDCNQWYKMKRHWLYFIMTGTEAFYLVTLLVADLLFY
jgi:hypothetical protein